MAFLDQHVVYPSLRLFKCVCVCVCRAISNLNLFLCGKSLWSLPSSMCVCVGQYKAFFKQLNDFCAQTIDSLLLLYNLIEAYSSWPNEMLTNSNKNKNNNSKWHLKYCIRERRKEQLLPEWGRFCAEFSLCLHLYCWLPLWLRLCLTHLVALCMFCMHKSHMYTYTHIHVQILAVLTARSVYSRSPSLSLSPCRLCFNFELHKFQLCIAQALN